MKEHNIMISAESNARLPSKASNVLKLSDKGNVDGDLAITYYKNIKSFREMNELYICKRMTWIII